MKGQMRLWNLLIAGVLLCSAVFGGARPQPVQAADSPIALSLTAPTTQDFSIGTTANAALPDGWAVSKNTTVRSVDDFPATGFATENLGGNNLSSSASNGIYNFGAGVAATATDRAVGFLSSSGATKSGNLYAHFNNGTGSDLAAVTISYNVEKYRNGSNLTGFTFQLYYSLTGTTWTSAGPTFKTSFTPDGDNNGFDSAPGTTQSIANQNLNVSIPNNSNFYLAWNYSVTSGTTTSNAQALAIDDFSILGIDATTTTNPYAIGSASPRRGLVGFMTTLLTVSVMPGLYPPSTGLNVVCDLTTINGSATQAFYDDGSHGDVATGDKIYSFSNVIDLSITPGAKNLACSVNDNEGRHGSTSIGLQIDTILPIGTINGVIDDTTVAATHDAAYKSQPAYVTGVIYEKSLQPTTTSPYNGFFIQNTAATADGDPKTSDGLFVYMGNATTLSGPSGAYTPTVGDEVTIGGTVTEYYNMTELSSAVLIKPVLRSGVVIDTEIPAVVANPPLNQLDANRYWERLQAMRVQVPLNSVVVSGRNVFSPPDGEIWVVRPDSDVAKRTAAYTNRVFRDAHPLDDNYDATNWDGNGYRILMGSWGIKGAAGDGNALIDPAHTFDTVTNTPAGAINYSFSKYRIEVTTQPSFSSVTDPAANNPPQAILDRTTAYSIVDYNLENLYDFRDNPFSGCDFAGNGNCLNDGTPFIDPVKSPFNYIPANDADYQARLNDIALQIKNDLHGPDILMVQEVENQDICTVTEGVYTCGTSNNADGKPDVLQELALKIAANGGPAYDAAWDRDSSDLRGIAPAYLYRTDRVQLLPPASDPVLGVNPAITYAGAPVAYDSDVSNPKTLNAVLPVGVAACETTWVFPRAPDVALFRIYQTSIGTGSYQDVYTINNHFKSGPDTCVTHRTEQAKYNAALVAFIQASNPDARVVMGGDLNVYPRPDDNAYGASDQLGSLYAPSLGLTNMYDVMVNQTPESAYSYVYVGMAQTLDQVFLNQTMLTNLIQVQVAHINSDFASDYGGDVARGTSDHDPLVAVFSFTAQLPPTANVGGPYKVDQIKDIQLTATGTDPMGGTLIYTWDLDNDGTFETKGATATYHAGMVPGDHTVKVKVTGRTGLTKVVAVNVFVNFRYIFPVISN